MEPGKGSDLEKAEVQAPKPSFSVKRSSIPTVPQDDQNGELYDLGVDIYEHSTFEKEVLDQVGKALEIKIVNNEIHMVNKTMKNELDKNEGNQNSEPKAQENATADNKPISDVDLEYEEWSDTYVGRKVRMGEMTPFGTSISISTAELNCFSKVEKYLQDQIEAEKKRKELKRKSSIDTDQAEVKTAKTVKGRNPASKKQPAKTQQVAPQTGRKRQSKNLASGSYTSEGASNQTKKPRKTSAGAATPGKSSDSSYVPSEDDYSDSEEYEIPAPKKEKKPNTSSENTNGDVDEDSDWLYSDDENSKSKSKQDKEQDDGDIGYYYRRLAKWEKHNDRAEMESQVETLEGGLNVPLFIWNRLYKYQKVGVQWLWELHNHRVGGILGDEMGLGKTVQAITLLASLSITQAPVDSEFFRTLGPVLIVAPTTLLHQWVKEIHYWWPQFRVAVLHESGNYTGRRSKLIRDVVKNNGILVTSFVSCVQQRLHLTRYLWHYVILDEGHKIRNPESQITTAVKQLYTLHPLILSGSPMQNNLKELWSLFDFIYPGKLGSLPVFIAQFSVPIMQGGYANASNVQIATAYKCATVLRDCISPYLLRRVKEDVKSHINLPRKNEQILFCKLTDEQRNLYLDYINSTEVNSILSGRYKIFVGLINLRKICNHPHLYTGGPQVPEGADAALVPKKESYGYWKKSGKMIVVETLLKIWKKQGHRVLIFTQSRQMLTILELFVQSQGYSYLKLDGATTVSRRQPVIRQFNEDDSYFIFLSTTRVGGLGVNLTGADRVIIYDPDWNPATDTQARERAWRIGQKKQVTIYRLITTGTIEEKIYHRQIFKQFLTNKVLKNPRQKRLFKSNDLYELFTLKETDDETTETTTLFAGSKSEVNMKTLNRRRAKLERKLMTKAAELAKEADPAKILGEEKVEKMKQLAKLISQKIGSSTVTSQKDSDANKIEDVTNSSDNNCNGTVKINGKTKDESLKEKEEKKKSEEEFKRKVNNFLKKFEGERVPHLLGRLEHEKCSDLKNEYQEEQDNYILRKLYAKSEIKTALKHDRVMEVNPHDYVLVEGEAEKIARDAVAALKESRRAYFESLYCMTSSGTRRLLYDRMGRLIHITINRRCLKRDMSSKELIILLRERHRFLNDTYDNLIVPGQDENLELLTDMRNFIANGARASNVASTQEIVEKFRERLPDGKSPLVRALLEKICDFSREPNGTGMWSLKQDFRW